MKKNHLVKIVCTFMVMVFVTGLALSCAQQKGGDVDIEYYTCPMHPQIHRDEPGNCPICGMKLVPVHKEHTESDMTNHTQQVLISEDKQKMMGVTAASVQTRPVKKTIKTFGRVAFDPKLAAAQKEYVEIVKSSPSLENAARNRLKIMGMSEEEINELKKTRHVGSNLYLPDGKDKFWVYATVYENDRDLISIDMPVVVKAASPEDEIVNGIVRGLSPVVEEMSRVTTARIEVIDENIFLKPNTPVDVYFEADLGHALVMPKTALIDTGEKKIAYVIHDQTHLEPREIKTGAVAEDDVVVVSGLTEGERVVTNATFLVDSEAQLRGLGQAVGHQH